MRNRRRIILFALVGCLAVSACTDRYGSVPPAAEYNQTPGYYIESPYEKVVTAMVGELCKESGLEEGLAPDRALSAAARNITVEIKKTNLDLITKMGNDRIKDAMTEEGITDNAFRSLLMNVVRIKDAKSELRKNLSADIQTGRFTHFGVGAVRVLWPPTIVISVLLTRKSATLSPLPRAVPPGEDIHLSGRVLVRGENLSVLVQGPKRTATFTPAVYTGGLFSQDLVLNSPGTYTIELMMDTDYGPEVAALFPVKVEGSAREEAAAEIARVPVADVAQGRKRLLDLINQERARRDLLPLVLDERVNKIAQDYAEEMKRTSVVAHVSGKTGDCADRAKAAGIRYQRITENIAVNQTLEQVHESLMSSPSHARNIFDSEVDWAGLGIAFTKDKNQVFVVENFVRYQK